MAAGVSKRRHAHASVRVARVRSTAEGQGVGRRMRCSPRAVHAALGEAWVCACGSVSEDRAVFLSGWFPAQYFR